MYTCPQRLGFEAVYGMREEGFEEMSTGSRRPAQDCKSLLTQNGPSHTFNQQVAIRRKQRVDAAVQTEDAWPTLAGGQASGLVPYVHVCDIKTVVYR